MQSFQPKIGYKILKETEGQHKQVNEEQGKQCKKQCTVCTYLQSNRGKEHVADDY